MVDFMATRTAFFDEFFLGAADTGVRQVVILASGLDARAWRLPWPDGTVVYELDQPKVLEFKSEHAARARRAADGATGERADRPAPGLAEGVAGGRDLTPHGRCVWSAEGLVRYLPAQAQDLLFERIHSLSAAGSWLASNVPAEGFTDPDRVQRQREDMQRMRAAAAKLVDAEITDFDDLWYPEERTPVDDWLREHGWDVIDGDLRRIDGALRPQRSGRRRGLDAAHPLRVRAAAGRRWRRRCIVAAMADRRARVDDVHQIAASMPHVKRLEGPKGNSIYQVGGKSFVFFRTPQPDATDPRHRRTLRRRDHALGGVGERQAGADSGSRFAVLHHRPLRRASLGTGAGQPAARKSARTELTELIQDAWLSRASKKRAATWLADAVAYATGRPESDAQ